jgi:hypothetical protein
MDKEGKGSSGNGDRTGDGGKDEGTAYAAHECVPGMPPASGKCSPLEGRVVIASEEISDLRRMNEELEWRVEDLRQGNGILNEIYSSKVDAERCRVAELEELLAQHGIAVPPRDERKERVRSTTLTGIPIIMVGEEGADTADAGKKDEPKLVVLDPKGYIEDFVNNIRDNLTRMLDEAGGDYNRFSEALSSSYQEYMRKARIDFTTELARRGATKEEVVEIQTRMIKAEVIFNHLYADIDAAAAVLDFKTRSAAERGAKLAEKEKELEQKAAEMAALQERAGGLAEDIRMCDEMSAALEEGEKTLNAEKMALAKERRDFYRELTRQRAELEKEMQSKRDDIEKGITEVTRVGREHHEWLKERREEALSMRSALSLLEDALKDSAEIALHEFRTLPARLRNIKEVYSPEAVALFIRPEYIGMVRNAAQKLEREAKTPSMTVGMTESAQTRLESILAERGIAEEAITGNDPLVGAYFIAPISKITKARSEERQGRKTNIAYFCIIAPKEQGNDIQPRYLETLSAVKCSLERDLLKNYNTFHLYVARLEYLAGRIRRMEELVSAKDH